MTERLVFPVFLLLGISIAAAMVFFTGNADFKAQVAQETTVAANVQDTWVKTTNTLVLNGREVLLDGIATPRRSEDGYREGRRFVDKLLRTAVTIECKLEGRRSNSREVAQCWFIKEDGSKIDPQERTVAAGWARDCPKFSGGRYRKAETAKSLALRLPEFCVAAQKR